MRRKVVKDFLICFAISALILSIIGYAYVFAQSTTLVTATVVDPNNNPYASGTASAIVQVPAGNPTSPPVNVTTSSLGAFSMNLPAGSYVFTVCASPTLLGQPTTNPTPRQICLQSPPISVSGGSLDISTQLNAVAPILGPRITTAGAGGSNAQAQVNNNGVIAGTPCETYASVVSGPINIGCDWHPKGPNPYVDATTFGVRAVNPNIAPAISGVNCTTTGGQPTVTISSASTFQNGDGIVCQNAGAANGLGAAPTPTVAPFNSRAGTGTGDGVAAPAGATTYNYTVFACDVGGGCTAAGTAGSTATGNASLGSQSQTGYSATRSNDTWTYTVGSAPPFSAGTVVTIDTPTSGTADADFEGTYKVSTVTGTGFTVANAPLDTRSSPPARTASLGTYTVHYFNYNKVTWSAVTGSPFRYFVCSDRASPGTFHVLGTDLLPQNPVNTGFNDGALEFDDFGATMLAQSINNLPWYVTDANCTGAATNDNWVTKIASGAGTTTLTMSGNAPNSNGGPLTIRFDNTPNLITAVTAAGATPVELAFPSSGSYVFNSAANLTSLTPILMIPAGAIFNDTLIINGNAAGSKLYGDRLPGGSSATQFQSQSKPIISGNAWPLILCSNGFACVTSSLQFSAPNNGIAFLQDGGSGALGSTYTDSAFLTGSQSTDYMGIGFVCRGTAGADCRASFNGKTLISSGTQAMANLSATPSFYCDFCADIIFNELMGGARALAFFGTVAGGTVGVRITHADWQGGSTPFIMTGLKSASGGGYIILGRIVLDTMAQPCITNLNALSLISSVASGCLPSSSVPQFTGIRNGGGLNEPQLSTTTGQNRDAASLVFGLAYDGIFGSGAAANYSKQQFGSAISTSAATGIFVEGAQPAQPTCSVSAGGSVAIATYTFIVTPVWWDNSEGTNSPSSASCTTTSGNQTVTVNWTTVPGNPKGYDLYANGSRNNWNSTTGCNRPQFVQGTTQLVWASTGGCGNQAVNITSGGPTAMLPGTQGIAAPRVIVGGDTAFTSAPRGMFGGQALALNVNGRVMGMPPDVPITVTAISFTVPPGGTVGLGCTTAPQVRVTDGTNLTSLLTLPNGSGSGNLTGLSTNYPAGADMRLEVSISSIGCTTAWANVNFIVQYRMQ